MLVLVDTNVEVQYKDGDVGMEKIPRGVLNKGNESPRSNLRGIKCSDQILEKRELATVNLVVRFTLFLHIFPHYVFISILPYGVRVVAAGPEFPSP